MPKILYEKVYYVGNFEKEGDVKREAEREAERDGFKDIRSYVDIWSQNRIELLTALLDETDSREQSKTTDQDNRLNKKL